MAHSRLFRLAALAALVLTGAAAGRALRSGGGPPDGPPPVDRAAIAVRDGDIAFYAARVARDPRGALDRARLGALYLLRARETGSPADLERAEDVARASLRIRGVRNTVALQVLASAQLSRHEYLGADSSARFLLAADTSAAPARAQLAEIEMELGRYPSADSLFQAVRGAARSLSVGPRLARWEELTGHPEAARARLRASRAAADSLPFLPAEQRAWFDLRVGDLALRGGHLREADRAYRAGLEVAPADYRLLYAMARLRALQQDWDDAIAWGERSLAQVAEPATFGLLSDAYAAAGDSAQAAEYLRGMEVAILQQPGSFHRAWSLFLLDHGLHVPDVLARAAADTLTRHDIYGYDLLGWALYRSGQPAAAAAAMQLARRLHTPDALLAYHDGMITLARGDSAAACRTLEAALALNPAFDYRGAPSARQTVNDLRRRASCRTS